MNKNYLVIVALFLLPLLIVLFIQLKLKNTQNDKGITKQACKEMMVELEKILFRSIPLSQGAEQVLAFLEKDTTFVQNEKKDYVFNAQNATFFTFPLVDTKSLFMVKYFIFPNRESRLNYFQAIYFFKNREDKKKALQKIQGILDDKLSLKMEPHPDIIGVFYKRYFTLCNTDFNFKVSSDDDEEHIINIFWSNDVSK